MDLCSHIYKPSAPTQHSKPMIVEDHSTSDWKDPEIFSLSNYSYSQQEKGKEYSITHDIPGKDFLNGIKTIWQLLWIDFPDLQLPLLLHAEVGRKTTFTDPLAVTCIQLDAVAQRFRNWNEIGAMLQCPSLFC